MKNKTMQDMIDKTFDYMIYTREESANPQRFDGGISYTVNDYVESNYESLSKEEKKEIKEAVLDLYEDWVKWVEEE